MNIYIKKLYKLYYGNSLAFIKFIYGIVMAFLSLRYFLYGWIEKYFIIPKFHFRYPYFEWVPLIPDYLIYYVFIVIFVFSLLFAFGIFYKFSLLMVLVSFSWVFFQDITYYINHHYFLIILGIYFLVFPEPNHNFLSKRNVYPFWGILILRLQVTFIYLHAGFIKINTEWLQGLPLEIWLSRNTVIPIEWISLKNQAILFSWLGMIYDLSIPFLLFFRKTRLLGFLLVLGFHILTRILFEIGVFPWIMIFLSTIFFNPRWILNFKPNFIKCCIENKRIYQFKKYQIFISILWLSFQILFPLRFILKLPSLNIKSYMNEVYWKENNFRWSWRVMVSQKSGYVLFYVHTDEGVYIHDPRNILTPMQYDMMSYQGDMICQYAMHLLKNNREYNKIRYIRIESFVSWNGRKSRPYMDDNPVVSKKDCRIKDYD